jgi:microcystin-dependent protein
MSNPYIGEIRMFGGNFAPAGWAFCNGQTLAISQNDALFTLIGTTYGGDGQETFNLPDLQGRLPMHMGTNAGTTFTIGENAGTEEVTLTVQQIPIHSHPMVASTNTGTQANPGGNVLATSGSNLQMFIEDQPNVNMAANSVSPVGGSQPHTNLQPYLCISFILSLFGVFPTQS